MARFKYAFFLMKGWLKDQEERRERKEKQKKH